jgi:NADPH-dependent F420 reductase
VSENPQKIGSASRPVEGSVQTIGIIGGTGKEGKGLAYRWAKAGYTVLIGSRAIEKAQAAAEEINALLDGSNPVAGIENEKAALLADLVVLTVPFGVHQEMLSALKQPLQGKILIDVTVPLVPPRVTRVQMPPAGSAGLEAQQILGEGVQVVAAFQNISYEHLLHEDEITCDVLVCGSSKNARGVVLGLVKAAGLVGWDAGPLENSMVVEGMTSILIGLNKQYGVQSAGIRITGIPRE